MSTKGREEEQMTSEEEKAKSVRHPLTLLQLLNMRHLKKENIEELEKLIEMTQSFNYCMSK